MSAADLAKQHGPGVAVGTLALAVALASGGSTSIETVRVAQTGSAHMAPEQPRSTMPAVGVSLVTCGDMRKGARVDGDSHGGTIHLGPGAGGKCTLVLDRELKASCSVDGAKSARIVGTDLVIEGAADIVTYRCEAR